MYKRQRRNTSWQRVSDWYQQKQGVAGSYYYQKLIIPKTLTLLSLTPTDSLLDLGCGQGILERAIPRDTKYVGIDLAKDLIRHAMANALNSAHRFLAGDITKPLPISTETHFTRIAVILTLQNLQSLNGLFANIAKHLDRAGSAVIVLNHPYFRIPRQTSWAIDEQNKLQYRRVNRYQSSLKIPIEMHPGQKTKTLTWSFHYPLWLISEELHRNGLVIEKIEEWISDKTSVGKVAKMENFSRREFPLFMALRLKNQNLSQRELELS